MSERRNLTATQVIGEAFRAGADVGWDAAKDACEILTEQLSRQLDDANTRLQVAMADIKKLQAKLAKAKALPHAGNPEDQGR